MARRKTGILASLRAHGFDTSRVVPFERGAKVGCSQCEAAVVNGVACHEHGCPNEVHECRTKGCGNTVERRGMYCDDCSDWGDDVPMCVAAMGCLCAGHARGNPVHDECDTREEESVEEEEEEGV